MLARSSAKMSTFFDVCQCVSNQDTTISKGMTRSEESIKGRAKTDVIGITKLR